jgi:hypothetical protein
MPDWLARIIQQWEAIVAAPIPFLTVVAAVAILIWLGLSYAYQTRLASRDGEISLLVRQRDEYKDKLGGASPEQAKILIAELRAEVESLGKKLQERDIEPDIANQIVNELKAGGSHEIQVTYATGDKSSAKFADTIAALLKRGGWKVRGPKAVYYFGSVFDLSILVGPGGDSDGARLLASIFNRHGMSIDVNINQSDENQCDLIVGIRSR